VLVRLTSEQISRCYDHLEAAVRVSVPPTGGREKGSEQKVMENLLAGRMQAWLLCVEGEDLEIESAHAAVITVLMKDPGTGFPTLLVYSLCADTETPPALAEDGIDTLRKYARSQGANLLSMFTSVPKVRDLVRAIGGSSDDWYLTLEV